MLEMDCLVVFAVAALQSYNIEGKPVDSVVKLHSPMTLECTYPKTAFITQISWSKEDDKDKKNFAVFRLPKDLSIKNGYKDRIHVANDTAENKSLVFYNATKEDLGFYRCSFHTFPDGIWEKRIEVVHSEDLEVNVPSYHHMVTETGKNITFTNCHGLDVAAIVWERILAGRKDFMVQCDGSGVATLGLDYEQRVEIGCATQANSSMVLLNVTAADSGIYGCYSIGINGKNYTSWTKLTVNDHVPLLFPGYLTFSAGAVGLLLIIILIIAMRICYRKQKKKKKMKVLHLAEIGPTNKYGRSDLQSTANAKREQMPLDSVYVNCKDCSHRFNNRM